MLDAGYWMLSVIRHASNVLYFNVSRLVVRPRAFVDIYIVSKCPDRCSGTHLCKSRFMNIK
jgi:hypothetical protein